ncbi:peroxisomal N(1)-acetyl-spermine/spermidine oxidase-like [Montipora capricornis]|uniref:peroxisomal N(1)-acetyl-spermine/spermidine oxidase-like n=1 Tax=Montipora capricornis TaxID=246305 RepID=UPI0035F19259
MMAPRPKVVVIGAGIAGLSAAAKLYQSGQVEVCVLEASDRVGGRMHTAMIGNTKVEFGATFIHGTVENPIFDLACDLQMLDKADINKSSVYGGSRVKPEIRGIPISYVDDELLTEVWDVFYNLITESEDVAKMKSWNTDVMKGASKMTVGDYLNHGFQSYLHDFCASDKKEIKAAKHSLFTLFQERECNSLGCHSLYNLNLEEFGEYYDFDGSDHCPVPGGYDSILKAVQVQFDINCIHFHHMVTQIIWSTSFGHFSKKSHYPVKILCSNGESFDADHVILTVSLGVLKEKWSSLFTPTLPACKINAIEKLGFGFVGKIVLEFEDRFWSTAECAIPVLWEDREVCKQDNDLNDVKYGKERQMLHSCSWVHRLYGFYTSCPGSNILVAWFHGIEALEIENSSSQQVAEICLATLKRCTSLKSLPRLLNVHVTHWATNPLTRGSYSFLSKEAKGSDFDCLASPLPHVSADNKGIPALQVMFAGEATNRHVYGTVHGAYLTGIREAERVLEYLSSNEKGCE